MGSDVWIKPQEEGKSEDELYDIAVEEVTARYESQGEKVYFIPLGGSNEIGALGYYECAMKQQIKSGKPVFLTAAWSRP